MAYGHSGHLAVSFQNSYGTVRTDSAHFIPIISEGLAESIEQIVESNMYGRLAESPYHEGAHEVRGEVRGEALPISVGVLLKAALGQASVTAQGSVYVHEFLPASADWDGYAAVPPLTLQAHRDVGSAFVYYDMLANDLTLEIAHGQLLSCTAGLLGGKFTRNAPATPSYPPGHPWGWDVASASYAGAALQELRQLTIKFDNRLSTQHTLSGQKTPSRVKRDAPQRIAVEGTFLLQDQALFQEFLNQSEQRLLLTLRGEDISSGYAAALTLDVPKLRFSELAPQLSGPGALEVSFTAQAVYDTTSAYALRATLTNTQPSY